MESLVKRLHWEVHFFLNENAQSTQRETYGFIHLKIEDIMKIRGP